jgi:hypothetical protein
MTKDNSNITETQRILNVLRIDIEKIQRMGNQGTILLARKILPTKRPDEKQLSVEETFIGFMQQADQQVQGLMFLEEVFKSHIKIMKENNKITKSKKK